jgi:hypothetical protein
VNALNRPSTIQLEAIEEQDPKKGCVLGRSSNTKTLTALNKERICSFFFFEGLVAQL